VGAEHVYQINRTKYFENFADIEKRNSSRRLFNFADLPSCEIKGIKRHDKPGQDGKVP